MKAKNIEAAAQYFETLVSDLRLLSDLHAIELDADRIELLKQINFPVELSLVPSNDALDLALHQMEECIKQWQSIDSNDLIDALATDYADIYLNGTIQAHPSESPWLDDEGLVCQQPMFDVRQLYAEHGLAVPNWRRMADDHIVNELLFISFLFEQAGKGDSHKYLMEAARFMDQHLLKWVAQFGNRVAARCGTPFYAVLALLTSEYTEQIRNLLASVLNYPHAPEDSADATATSPRTANGFPPTAYCPGTAPSW